MANIRESAARVFSPPDMASRYCTSLPLGFTTRLTPPEKGSSSLSSIIYALPPGDS